MVPVGTVIMHTGTTTLTGYLYCDGSLVSTTTYSQLFDVIGTKYGSGTGTFAVPNFKDKFPLGASNMATLLSPLNTTTGGAFGITAGNLPAHGHTAIFAGITGTIQNGLTGVSPNIRNVNGQGQANAMNDITAYSGQTSFTPSGTVTVYNSPAPTSQYYPPFTTINYFIKF
jgi:microcystin-dependent protein